MPQRRIIDRAAANAAYAAGASLSAIARQQGVSRQAIAAVQKAEGWERSAEMLRLGATATGKRLLSPASKADRALVHQGKRDFLAMQAVVRTVAAGGSRSMAAAAAGISGELLRQWLIEDPDFLREVERAEAEKGLRRIGRLEAAGERGDVTADRFLLTSDPSSRREWGSPLGHGFGAAEGQAVTINLVLTGDAGTLLGQPPAPAVIDAQPEAAVTGSFSHNQEASEP